MLEANKVEVINEFLTQKELATRWCRSPSTISNYRKQGKLPCFQLPGSDKPLYPLDQILEIESQYTFQAKEVKQRRKRAEISRERPVISTRKQQEWRI
jgi:hypothetical protein